MKTFSNLLLGLLFVFGFLIVNAQMGGGEIPLTMTMRDDISGTWSANINAYTSSGALPFLAESAEIGQWDCIVELYRDSDSDGNFNRASDQYLNFVTVNNASFSVSGSISSPGVAGNYFYVMDCYPFPTTLTAPNSTIVPGGLVRLTVTDPPATITVYQIDQLGNPKTGGTFTISPGSCTASPCVVYPEAVGKSYSIAVNTFPSTCTSATVTNSDGGGSSMVVYPSNAKSFTITYTCPPDPVPIVDLDGKPAGGGVYGDGPITITPGANIDLTWTSQNAVSCSASNNGSVSNWTGSKTPVASGSQAGVGPVTVNPTTFTLTCLNNTGDPGSKSFVVNLALVPPTVTATTGSCGGQINLNWNTVSGATGYKIYRGGVYVTQVAGTSYTNTGLTPGASYSYTVRATNGTIDSPDSSPLATATASAVCVTPPATPIGLTATASSCGTGTINVSWNASSGATSYTLRDGVTVIYTGASTSFSHTGLSAGSSHSYSVLATNAAGSSSYSGATAGTAPAVCAVPPSVPTGLSVTSSSCGTGTINVSWNASSGATSYTLRDSATVIYTGASTSFSHTGLVAGSSHSYSVLATNAAGSSSYSGAVAGTAPSACPLPVPVVTISANPTSGTVNVVNPSLTWGATNSPTSCTASGDWSGAKAVSGTNVSQGVLNTVKTYTYTLICANAGGNSAPASATVVVSAAGDTLPVVAFTQPAEGAVISGTVAYGGVKATANDPDIGASNGAGILRVEFELRQSSTVLNTATENTAPYDYGFNSTSYPNGPYTLRAIAYGTVAAGGGSSFVDRAITINNAPTTATITVNQSGFTTGTWSLSPGPITGTGASSANTVTPAACAGGTTYTITPQTVGGYDWSVSPSSSLNVCPGGSITFNITYTAVSTFNYSLSAQNVSIYQGQSGQSTVTETYGSGTAEVVDISVSGQPGGVSVNVTESCTPTCPSTITFTVGGAVPAGSYPITVTGTSVTTSVVRTTPMTLTVQVPPASTVNVTSNPPTSAVVGQAVTWTAVAVGGLPPCTYSWTGTDIPGGDTGAVNTYTFTYQTTGTKSVTATATCSGVPSNGNGTINIGVNPLFREF